MISKKFPQISINENNRYVTREQNDIYDIYIVITNQLLTINSKIKSYHAINIKIPNGTYSIEECKNLYHEQNLTRIVKIHKHSISL